MIYLYLALTIVAGYLIGNINFARIFSWMFAKKDITTVGSKNPGTMNMLRTRGFGEALLTLLMEAVKSGAPALACYFLFKTYFPGYEDLAYFLSAIGAVVGHCFPVFYKFKGGKGVACTFGMFLFHPSCWWVSLVMFAICFLLFFFIEYPFIISLTFILTMSIYATCIFALAHVNLYIALIVVLWLNFVLIVFMHRGNIKRLVTGKENKVNFREKVFKKRSKKQDTDDKTDKQPTEESKDKNENPEDKNDETTTD